VILNTEENEELSEHGFRSLAGAKSNSGGWRRVNDHASVLLSVSFFRAFVLVGSASVALRAAYRAILSSTHSRVFHFQIQ